MRRLRDIEGELRALAEKTRRLKGVRLTQLGDLVIATGADALPFEILAGALLQAVEDPGGEAAAWRRKGEAFFRDQAAAKAACDPSPGEQEPGEGDGDDPPRRGVSGAARV